jgi:hypothetical protein
MSRIVSIVLCFCCLAAGLAGASTIVVHQDGSGDYTTIGAAMTAANSGDVIRVGMGTYSEYVTISKSVTLESESGAAVTTLDGLDVQRILVVDGAVTVTIRGFTFTRARADEGCALLVWHQPLVLVENCIFENNYAEGSNAVAVRHTGTSLHIRNCQFLRNRAAMHSAALSGSVDADLIVEDSQFIENQSFGHGAMNTQGCHIEMTGCLFLRNSGSVGAISLEYSTGFATGNTFHANSGSAASVRLRGGVSFTNNVVSGDIRGFGLDDDLGTQHGCNLYFENYLGASDEPLTADEVVADPLYCEPSADVLLVCSGSPALESQNGCGLMGAYGEGCTCGPISIETTSWGTVKSLFR